MYPSTPTPISEQYWDSFQQENVAPAVMQVDAPDMYGGGMGGEADGGGETMGALSQIGGQVGGEWLRGQADQAGGFSNLPRMWGSKVGLAPPIYKPLPTMAPDAADPVGASAGLSGTLTRSTPFGTGQAGTWIPPGAEASTAAAAPTASAALPGAATAGAGSILPALGPLMSLSQGKKKTAGLGMLGTLAGAPFGPPGMAIGGMVGSMLGGGE